MFRQKILSMVLLGGLLLGQSVPQAMAETNCDQAQFVSDLTAPDGAVFAPGTMFTKTWRFMNIGTCAWNTSYNIVFVGGDAIGAPLSVKLPVDVPAGQLADLSINLTAPTTPGHYKGLWKFTNASGTQFGIGDSGGDAFWVDINVVSTNAVIYDFVANAHYAQWKSGVGILPYPGASGDYRGYAYQVDKPHLEDDSFESLPGLITVPQNKYNGYVQATYPEFQVQQGDKLQTLVNCEFGATSCYVTFRIDYVLSNGLQKTLWSWKEAYDKRFYRADIDLSSLAGQKVRFVLMLLSTGLASGDRAIWGSPRIIRAGTTQPPAPPATLTLLPPLTPTQTPITPPPPTIQTAGCDRASFVSDINIPDGTIFSPGASFSKTWQLRNSGTCTWTKSYKLIYYSGDQMSGPTSVDMPYTIYPGQTVEISANLVAPNNAGSYRGYWIFSNANGTLFGIGTDASKPFWVEIKVSGDAPYEGGYQLWANACSAQWKSGAGALPCPGVEGDNKGFIIPQNFSHLEDGTMGPLPSLLMSPENKYNGYIQGTFPAVTVQPGDHFVTTVGCEYGNNCYVTFRLDYMTPNGGIFNFWSWREQNDKMNYVASVDLTPLAGRSVRFILTLLATGSPTGDRVRWGGPTIVRAGGTSTTPVPVTSTPIPGTVVSSPQISKLYMMDASNGWAISNSYALRTTNGGTTWYNTLPEATNVTGGYFLNSTTGWVITPHVLYRTTNGGANWTRYDNLPFNNGNLQFLDTNTGYLLEITGAATNKQSVILYKTTDGGATWAIKYNNDPNAPGAGNTLPLGGHKNAMTFRDATTGWVGGDIPINGFIYLYKTTDSGITWSQQSMQIPAGYENAYITTSAPKFFGPNDGILPVWMTIGIGARDLFIYSTHNGGATWSISPTFIRQGNNTDFVSMNDGITWDWNGVFHVTNNTGASWNNVTPNINFRDDMPDMDFVSTSTGWLIQNQVNGTTPLYRTSDGARTWTLISGSISSPTSTPVPPPTADPSAFGQSVINALNARDFNTVRTSMDQSFVFAYWQSQGTAYTSDLAIEQLQTNHLGATSLVPDPNKDLVSLLGGTDPYSLVGLDPANSQALFVAGWGLDGKDEAILYFTRRQDNSMYWYSILIAKGGFVPEPVPVSHESFCADTRIPALIEQLKTSLNQSNGEPFSSLVSPTHGVNVHLWAYAPAVNFNTTSAMNIFTDTAVYDWGAGPSGAPDRGTFKDLIQPKLLEVFNAPNMETYCDDLTNVFPLTHPWPYPDIHYYNLYKPGTPGIGLDFRTLLIGFEYINDQPYVYGIVNIVWEP